MCACPARRASRGTVAASVRVTSLIQKKLCGYAAGAQTCSGQGPFQDRGNLRAVCHRLPVTFQLGHESVVVCHAREGLLQSAAEAERLQLVVLRLRKRALLRERV